MNSINPIRFKSLLTLLLSTLIGYSCSNQKTLNYYIIHGINASNVEMNTILDLHEDLEKVISGNVTIISEDDNLPPTGIFYLVGTINTNTLLSKLLNKPKYKFPKKREGFWSKTNLNNNQKAIVLSGANDQGLQYAVYAYSKEILGIDPLEYWTGKTPTKKNQTEVFDFENKTVHPPKVPILCYFENDVDELANYRGRILEYDWESYTELINSLVRLRYNAIQLFDMLGRPEYFLRPEYKSLKPDYQVDEAYINKMIDYAHSKGMKIQVDFALGYQIKPMAEDKANCWAAHKEDWISAWKYYLEKTPLSKTDIFVLRPRNQVWDWEYKSSCGEDKMAVFNEVYQVFGDLVDSYHTNAIKVLVAYSDGMQMWNEGFRPPSDWIVAWADDGFGGFKLLPNTTDGYNFGTYMHAGYWLNHTVQDPYPNLVETKMKIMFNDYNADTYCLVNGQNFRPFLLNLEAYSEVTNNPDTFNGEEFYTQWCMRYFGKETAPYAIVSMKKLHEAQFNRVGYVQHLWEIREAISYLSNAPIKRPGKEPIPYDYARVESDYDSLEKRVKSISEALASSDKGQTLITAEKASFYHDYITLPIQLYNDLLTFENSLHEMCRLKKKYEETNKVIHLKKALSLVDKAKKELKIIYDRRIKGDENKKWKGWYNPAIRRPNNGFPTQNMLNTIADNLTSIAEIK